MEIALPNATSSHSNDHFIETILNDIQQLTHAIALNGLLSARWEDAPNGDTMELYAPDFDALANDALDLVSELDAKVATGSKSP